MFGMITKARHEREMAEAEAEIVSLTSSLAYERSRARTSGQLASDLLGERDAARIERDTAQQERDDYRPDALKHRASRSNLKQFRGTGAVAGGNQAATLNA